MASNIVQFVLAVLVLLPPALSSSAHLPNPLDNNDHLLAQEENSHSGGEEESNIILLNNINKKIWDANSLAPDDIRCYCNLPACVSNGYMCRTARSHPDGGCFSERLQLAAGETQPSLPARHGCTNLLIESKESFKCDNNHQTVNRKEVKGGASSMTTVMCCHEDMCNHEGTDGRRVSAVATKSLLQLQQRIKLNQQRDVAMAPSSSSSGSVASTAALTGLKNGGTAGASASPAAAAVQSDDHQRPLQIQHPRQAKYNQQSSPRGAVDSSPSAAVAAAAGASISSVDISAEAEKQDVVDTQYQFSDTEQQNFVIKVVTCFVAVLGLICVLTLLYIGIRLLSNDGMGSSPASKLNRSDDSGHIMIGASTPEGKMTMEPKYYIAATHGSGTAKNLFATHVTPTMPRTAYQPLAAVATAQKNENCGDKLSALEYQLLAPELVSKLEKGSSGDDERLLKPMISSSNRSSSNSSRINNNSCSKNNSSRINNNSHKGPTAECNCNLAKNCRNCCSTNVKFTNELWRNKDNRQQK